MQPLFLDLGAVRIHWYGVMMALAFLAALANWVLLGRRHGRSAAFCSDLLFWIMLSGIAGARLAYVLEHWQVYAANPLQFFAIQQGGLVFYGGFTGAAIAVVLLARRHHEPLIELIDFTVTSVPLAHAFGRVGCFLNGCCYGRITEACCGVRFPALSHAWWAQQPLQTEPRRHELDAMIAAMPRSLPVHPVQLYEAVGNVALYLLVLWIYRHQARPGFVTAIYLMCYAIFRFAVEGLRGDRAERLGVFFGLSIAQGISILLLLLGAGLLVVLKATDKRHA